MGTPLMFLYAVTTLSTVSRFILLLLLQKGNGPMFSVSQRKKPDAFLTAVVWLSSKVYEVRIGCISQEEAPPADHRCWISNPSKRGLQSRNRSTASQSSLREGFSLRHLQFALREAISEKTVFSAKGRHPVSRLTTKPMKTHRFMANVKQEEGPALSADHCLSLKLLKVIF
ncbi:hypothetical protein Anapl_03463 [Anas platyrhynchos]|uniref:Uncharacterized protein n=1 Tax=Anas platyrhynchos TaxID=8839 RepID=R0L3M6_ANAPL|nr:hypothetical protein Anapl_03463 [Anas platyrhynchos]